MLENITSRMIKRTADTAGFKQGKGFCETIDRKLILIDCVTGLSHHWVLLCIYSKEMFIISLSPIVNSCTWFTLKSILIKNNCFDNFSFKNDDRQFWWKSWPPNDHVMTFIVKKVLICQSTSKPNKRNLLG